MVAKKHWKWTPFSHYWPLVYSNFNLPNNMFNCLLIIIYKAVWDDTYSLLTITLCQHVVWRSLLKFVVIKLARSCCNNLLQVWRSTSCQQVVNNNLSQVVDHNTLSTSCFNKFATIGCREACRKLFQQFATGLHDGQHPVNKLLTNSLLRVVGLTSLSQLVQQLAASC